MTKHNWADKAAELIGRTISAGRPAVLREFTNSPILTFEELSASLNSHPAVPGVLKFIHEGRSFDAPAIHRPWRTEWDGGVLNTMWRGGYSMIVHNARINAAVSALVTALDTKLERFCDAHCYLGNGSSESFEIHSDWPDNLIVQAEGRTRWTVFEERWNPDKAAGARLSESSLTVVIDDVLEPGDAIFVDSMRLHLARPLSDRLSVSFPMSTRAQEPGAIPLGFTPIEFG